MGRRNLAGEAEVECAEVREQQGPEAGGAGREAGYRHWSARLPHEVSL